MVSQVNVTHMHPKTPSAELFGCLTKSLYGHRYFLSTVSHYISSATAGAGVEHWAQGGRFSRVLDGEIISLSARGMQTVNRESKQADVNLLCCNQYSGLDQGRNNPMKCQHIQLEAFMFCMAGSPSTLFLPECYSVIGKLWYFFICCEFFVAYKPHMTTRILQLMNANDKKEDAPCCVGL